VMIQSEGDNWRAFRNGPLSTYGVWGLAGIVGLLALFFLVRGRIRIEAGPSNERVTRFVGIERFGHWLTAVSFIVLGLTGLNVLYGRYFLKDAIGSEAFAQITFYGKLLHNYVAFAFMLGLVLILIMWIKDNFPSRTDFGWIIRGGGLLSKHSHPPAKKFNAGQKLIFWLVILGGASLSLSGLALMFPFEFPMFAKTFEAINALGFERIAGYALPTELTPIEEMQLSQLWHAIMALFMIVVIIAHIYIGSIGMEGAFAAMGSGEVDANWAREHHSIWYEKVQARRHAGDKQPAE
jgi:formate dehydrogenase subunit gamma